MSAATPLTVATDHVSHVSPEGQLFDMPLDNWLGLVREQLLDSCTGMLPPGVRWVKQRGRHTIWVGEFPPMVRTVRWIASNSPAPYGPQATYTMRTLAWPYTVVLAVFDSGLLTAMNECYFRTAPLVSADDELCYPSLLNVSKFNPPDKKPLTWICTQHLDYRPIHSESNVIRRMEIGWRLLCQTLFDASFNLSSEHHEGSSWFSESKRVDKRLSTVERWEEETRKKSLFILEVPFLKTGYTLAQIVERTFSNLDNPPRAPTADDLTRILVNHARPRKPK